MATGICACVLVFVAAIGEVAALPSESQPLSSPAGVADVVLQVVFTTQEQTQRTETTLEADATQNQSDHRSTAATMVDSGPQATARETDHVVKPDVSFWGGGNPIATGVQPSLQEWSTVEAFYAGHTTGRGIWKWSNYLTAYDRHFSFFRGTPTALAEVGVQSGGSIDMWHGVLGSMCHVYGIDINPATLAFQDPTTTMTLGDQADVAMWANFFQSVAPGSIDILIDDGGHEPNQMLVTLRETYSHLNPGGFVAIEDIHGERYLNEFFHPAADYLQTQVGSLYAVHIYPFLLMVQKTGSTHLRPANILSFTGNPVRISTLQEIDTAIESNPGGYVILENPTWGSFFTADGLKNLFSVMNELHHFNMQDYPAKCATVSGEQFPQCMMYVHNSPKQDKIIGAHIFDRRVVIELAYSSPSIKAVRKGTVWKSYG